MVKGYFVCPDCGLVDKVEIQGYTTTNFYVNFSNADYNWSTYESEPENDSYIQTILCPICYNEIAKDLNIATDDYDTIYEYQVVIDTKSNKIKIGKFARELLIEYITNNVTLPEEFENKKEFTDEDLANIVKLMLLEKEE